MLFRIGCSVAIALIALVIGFTVSRVVSDATWTDQLTFAAIPSAMTFIAALLLFARDAAQHSATVRSVRSRLLKGNDTSDEQFLSSLPCDDPELLLETRNALSRFFGVPSSKLRRDVNLINDLHVDKLEPSFQFYVEDSVIASQAVDPKMFGFAMAGLTSIDDLTQAIRKVLDDMDGNDEARIAT